MHCIFPDKIIDTHVAPQQQDKMKLNEMSQHDVRSRQ